MSAILKAHIKATTAVLGIVLAAGGLGALADSPAAHAVYRLNIPSQNLNDALQAFALASRHKLFYQADLVNGKVNPALDGQYTTEEAVRRILAGTDLSYEISPDGVVFIRSKQSAPLSSSSSSSMVGEGGDTELRLAQSEPGAAQESAGSPSNENSRRKNPSEDSPGEKLEEIVVTAQRREERLVDAPLSISVIGGKELDISNGQGTAEAISRVPGVANNLGGGNIRTGQSGGTIAIRGVAPLSGGSTTAFYLDTVPFGYVPGSGFAVSPDVNAYDLARVEVLRGPQGTLYGASALNGVVRVLTNQPDLHEFEFKARTSISGTEGGDESYRADAALNVPLMDGKLAVRGVVGFQDLGGWLDNANEKNANDTQVANYRLRLLAEPTDRLSIGLLAWSSRSDVGAPSDSPNGETRPSVLDEHANLDFDLYGLTVQYDFGGAMLTSSTSNIDYDNFGRFDYRPFTGFDNYLNFVFASEVFSQEFALSSTGDGDWRWSLGAIYRDAQDFNSTLRTVASTGAFAPGYLAPTQESRHSESYAVFGEVTRLLFDGQWELTAGVRQFYDDSSYDETSNRNCVGGVPPTGCVGSPPPTALIHSAGEFDHLTPRLVAAWHPATNSTLYASYSEGFRSGFGQSGQAAALGYQPVEPDELTNYEIGYKASAWDGRVNFETAVFYIDWQDVQQQLLTTLSSSPLIIGAAQVNSGSASGVGFESGVSVEVIDGLTLSGNFSWSGLEFDAAVFNGATLLFEEGDRVLGSPEYTAAASVDYRWALGGGFDAHALVSANYLPEMVVSARSLPATQDSRLLARASFVLEAPGHWSASIFVENLTDDKGIVYDAFAGFTNPSHVWDTYLRPRTFGLQLQYRYGR